MHRAPCDHPKITLQITLCHPGGGAFPSGRPIETRDFARPRDTSWVTRGYLERIRGHAGPRRGERARKDYVIAPSDF